MYRCLVTLAAGTVIAASAIAQTPVGRSFPADALRGDLTIGQPPAATLNGQPAQLAPGARIRGQNNLLVLTGELSGQRLLVHYTLDNAGALKDIWILRPEEAARRPWPTRPDEAKSWLFDPVAQTWSKP